MHFIFAQHLGATHHIYHLKITLIGGINIHIKNTSILQALL